MQHYHTNTPDIPLWRMPARADVQDTANRVFGEGRAMTEIVEYPLPDGRRGRAAYTVSPDGKVKVEFVDSSGARVPKDFASIADFNSYHDRKIYVAPGSDEHASLVRDLDKSRHGSPQPDADGEATKTNFGAPQKATGSSTPAAKPAEVSVVLDATRRISAEEKAREREVLLDEARRAGAEDKARLAEWKKSPKRPRDEAEAKVWQEKQPEKDDASFDKVLPSEAERDFDPKPSNSGRQVAIRIQGDSETKGQYIVGPDDSRDVEGRSADFQAAAKSAEIPDKRGKIQFHILPEDEATELGFTERPKPKDDAKDKSSAAKNKPKPIKPIHPLLIDGVQKESSLAGEAGHPITARTSPKKTPEKTRASMRKTIDASLNEADSYKWVLSERKEFGLKRPGNASTGGVDHVTLLVEGDTVKVFLNDTTTPGQPKKSKKTHAKWRDQLLADFPKDAVGVRHFGFPDPALEAKIAKAFNDGEIYTRTIRGGPPTNAGREYALDTPVKVP